MKFNELFQLYFQRHAMVKNKCPKNTHYFYKVHGPRWGSVEVSKITRFQVQDWVDELGVKSPSAATRAAHMMSAIINWGIKRGYVKVANPCIGVEKFHIRSRDRFLLPCEMKRFQSALESESELIRDYFMMCLLTGARKTTVKKMKWDEIDIDLAMWRFDAKTAQADDVCIIPLSSGALAILERRMKQSNSPWVFPSPVGREHIREVRRPWNRILKKAQIENLRIHDLRRTLGSYLALEGESPYIIGKALGHKDQRSTAVYARLPLKRVRKAVDNVQRLFKEEDSA